MVDDRYIARMKQWMDDPSTTPDLRAAYQRLIDREQPKPKKTEQLASWNVLQNVQTPKDWRPQFKSFSIPTQRAADQLVSRAEGIDNLKDLGVFAATSMLPVAGPLGKIATAVQLAAETGDANAAAHWINLRKKLLSTLAEGETHTTSLETHLPKIGTSIEEAEANNLADLVNARSYPRSGTMDYNAWGKLNNRGLKTLQELHIPEEGIDKVTLGSNAQAMLENIPESEFLAAPSLSALRQYRPIKKAKGGHVKPVTSHAGERLPDFSSTVTEPRIDPEVADAILTATNFQGLGLPALGKAALSKIGGLAALGVIKNKGGNWLSGSVEDALRGLKKSPLVADSLNLNPELEAAYRQTDVGKLLDSQRRQHVNNWIDKNLTRYVKNEMATPEDPIRALAEGWPERKAAMLAQTNAKLDALTKKGAKLQAERGVPEHFLTRHRQDVLEAEKARDLIDAMEGLHYSPRVDNTMRRSPSAQANRKIAKELGLSSKEMAQSPTAQRWEDLTDSFVSPGTYAEHTPLGGYTEDALRSLGGQFAVDNPQAIAFARNRGSSLNDLGFTHLIDELSNAINPASGLPKHLQFEAANLGKVSVPQAVERVAQINAHRAMLKAEADAAKANNAATVLHKEYPDDPRGMRWVELKAPAPDPAIYKAGKIRGRDVLLDENGIEVVPDRQALEDALKYEGDTMQHCVGGYCPDVLEGRSRIFSLRDSKGRPHVTIETNPSFISQGEAVKQAREEGLKGFEFASRVNDLMEGKNLPYVIKQIKGKLNKAPEEDIKPYVQDFVKSGKWSGIGDFANTGWQHQRSDMAKELLDIAAQKGIDVPDYLTTDEMNNIFQAIGDTYKSNFAQGGTVQTNSTPSWPF